MTEYGRIHTDGSRSGGQPVVDNVMLDALQKDAGLPHLPTQETYQFRMAVSGEGPLAYQWSDKPHRLLYDACSIIEREAAMRQPPQNDALPAVGTEGRYVYEGMVELSCVVTAHVEGWLEVKFTLDDGEAIVRPSRFHAALEQSK